MRDPTCLACDGELLLRSNDRGNYSWSCAHECSPLETNVPSKEDISAFENAVVPSGKVNPSMLTKPLPIKFIDGLKVYMPFILYHFIECGWGPCYMSLYENAVVPHLDDPRVLDYVLRSPVVIDSSAESVNGLSEPKMYDELYRYLMGVDSPKVQAYLTQRFGHRFRTMG